MSEKPHTGTHENRTADSEIARGRKQRKTKGIQNEEENQKRAEDIAGLRGFTVYNISGVQGVFFVGCD